MTPSEMLRKLVGGMEVTVGNHALRTLLSEIADAAENVERERDDLGDEIKCMGERDD